MFILAEQVTFTLAEVSDVHGGVKSNNGLPSTTGVISERGQGPVSTLQQAARWPFNHNKQQNATQQQPWTFISQMLAVDQHSGPNQSKVT